MHWRMKIMGTGTEIWNRPLWLKAYDLEGRGGIGEAKLTEDPTQALQFPSLEAVMETWRQRSKTMPNRPYGDGGPNRPLTAYTIEPEMVV